MALFLNDLQIVARNGAYAYMPNVPQPHNCIVSENQATALKAGDIVTVDATVTNTHCPVLKKAAVNDVIFGVIAYDGRKKSYTALEKVAVAIEGSIIYMVAAGAISQGAKLYFNSAGKVTSTATAGNSIVGIAYTSAVAANDLIQVKLQYEKTEDLDDYLKKTDAASTYVPQTRTINSKPLSADVTLTASDVGAEPAQQ